jgi:hypothetical protein
LEGAVLGEVFEERHQSIFIDAQFVLSVCLVPKIGLIDWVIRHILQQVQLWAVTIFCASSMKIEGHSPVAQFAVVCREQLYAFRLFM